MNSRYSYPCVQAWKTRTRSPCMARSPRLPDPSSQSCAAYLPSPTRAVARISPMASSCASGWGDGAAGGVFPAAAAGLRSAASSRRPTSSSRSSKSLLPDCGPLRLPSSVGMIVSKTPPIDHGICGRGYPVAPGRLTRFCREANLAGSCACEEACTLGSATDRLCLSRDSFTAKEAR